MKLLPLIPWAIRRVVRGAESSIRPVGWARTRSFQRGISLIASLVATLLAVSGRFVIATPLGVTVPRVDLALHGSVPNPATSLTVSFSLPDAQPASLVAYDVSGREVSRSAVGVLGAGRHVVTLGTSPTLAPGVYLVHLIRGERRLVARTVVVR